MPETKSVEDVLPSVSLDLRIPSNGHSLLKINGEVLRGVTRCKVELDAEKMFPVVTITFAAKQVLMELPSALLTQERPVINIPVITKEK